MNKSERVARELAGWRGHYLSPASRKNERAITYRTIVRNVLEIVCEDEQEAAELINHWFPFSEFRG